MTWLSKKRFALPLLLLLCCSATPVLASERLANDMEDEDVACCQWLKKTVGDHFQLDMPAEVVNILLCYVQHPDIRFRVIAVVSKSVTDHGSYHCEPQYNQAHRTTITARHGPKNQRLILKARYISTTDPNELVPDPNKMLAYYESQDITIPRQITACIPLHFGMTYADYAQLAIHQYLGRRQYACPTNQSSGVLYTRIVPWLFDCIDYAMSRDQDGKCIMGSGVLKTKPHGFAKQICMLGWNRYCVQKRRLFNWQITTPLGIVSLNDISIAMLALFFTAYIIPECFKIKLVVRFFKHPHCPLDPFFTLSFMGHLTHAIIAYFDLGIVDVVMFNALQAISFVELVYERWRQTPKEGLA